MDAIFLQILNGLDKGGAYALIALGLTLIFGTLGVVNFAHGALFMLGAFCAVSLRKLLTLSKKVKGHFYPSLTKWGTLSFGGTLSKVKTVRRYLLRTGLNFRAVFCL